MKNLIPLIFVAVVFHGTALAQDGQRAGEQSDKQAGGLPILEKPGSGLVPYEQHLPSFTSMQRAARLYDIGRHYSAISHYQRAARFGDKFGQFNVGVMHLKGEGTDFDPVRAWAWLALSAERDYAVMQEWADDLWGFLDEAQRRDATAIYEDELLPEYGDAVALVRAQEEMDRDRRMMTGTRTGSMALGGSAQILFPNGDRRSQSAEQFYDPELWDLQRLIEYETWQMENMARTRVEIGEFETVEDEDDR